MYVTDLDRRAVIKPNRHCFTDHFSGPRRAVGSDVWVCVSGQQLLNEMIFDLDIWHAGSN